MINRINEILTEIRPDVDFLNEKALIDDGILDSFDIVSIISELNDEYSIAIRVTELGPANFNSIEAIESLVKRLKESSK
ncbi:MAG: acyl carrier protein [Bacteroidia bacterium]|nr:acyl carrier protein [Bacteroidia bacterium]